MQHSNNTVCKYLVLAATYTSVLGSDCLARMLDMCIMDDFPGVMCGSSASDSKKAPTNQLYTGFGMQLSI